MGISLFWRGRAAARRTRVPVAVAAVALVWFGPGQLALADVSTGAPASSTTAAAAGLNPGSIAALGAAAADMAAGSSAAGERAVALTLPRELRLDSTADAAVQVAALDARLAVLVATLTRADAALSSSVGKVDPSLRDPLADAAATLRSLRGQRTQPSIPAATAAVGRLTGPVVAAAAAFDVEQARLAAVAAEKKRLAAEAARAAEQAAAASRAAAVVGAGAGAGAGTAAGTDLTAVGEATLRSLPGNAGVHLAWNHPAIGSHLGGVFLDQDAEIMINGRQLSATPGRTASVVMHEIGHIYQARIIAADAPTRGGWSASYGVLVSRLDAIFGGNGVERAADCVALSSGATWTAYTSDCATPDRQAAVQALKQTRMP
ncbi:hypothetical protein [Pengzhenrongella phosphoraccumulans]|uniref:hypothetical protein n=1 Tax=Pengzhenrongella phosphoraccumulans TaxID=3114394 RepID=UPI00388F8053